jgi:hypothetical protein
MNRDFCKEMGNHRNGVERGKRFISNPARGCLLMDTRTPHEDFFCFSAARRAKGIKGSQLTCPMGWLIGRAAEKQKKCSGFIRASINRQPLAGFQAGLKVSSCEGVLRSPSPRPSPPGEGEAVDRSSKIGRSRIRHRCFEISLGNDRMAERARITDALPTIHPLLGESAGVRASLISTHFASHGGIQ